MSPFDMHRHPWFFLFCLNVAFVAGIVVAEDRRIEAETERAITAQVAPRACVADTRSWLVKTFDDQAAK